MLRHDPDCYRDSKYNVKGDLDDLIKRLKKGMTLNGRIVDCLGENKYLLRIWGYNILTESEQMFQQFEEISLHVKQVRPHLVLDLSKNDQLFKGINSENQTDILVY